jgi:hypothetical protein
MDSEVDLPSPIGSESDGDNDSIDLPAPVGSEDSDIELPPPVDGDLLGCTCRKQCYLLVSSDVVMQLRSKRKAMEWNERKQYGFNLVMQALGQDEEVPGKLKYKIGKDTVCRRFWQFAHALSPGTVDKYKKMIVINKAVSLPPEREKPAAPPRPQFDTADAWFFQLYQNIREPLPNSIHDCRPEGPLDIIGVESQEHPLWNLSVTLYKGNGAPRKYLSQGRIEDLYALHQMNLGDKCVSRSVLRQCFHQRWKKYLTWRCDSQGKRCNICAEIDEMRSKASTPEEKELCKREK